MGDYLAIREKLKVAAREKMRAENEVCFRDLRSDLAAMKKAGFKFPSSSSSVSSKCCFLSKTSVKGAKLLFLDNKKKNTSPTIIPTPSIQPPRPDSKEARKMKTCSKCPALPSRSPPPSQERLTPPSSSDSSVVTPPPNESQERPSLIVRLRVTQTFMKQLRREGAFQKKRKRMAPIQEEESAHCLEKKRAACDGAQDKYSDHL